MDIESLTYVEVDGALIESVSDFSVTPQGGESTPVLAMNPSKRAIGYTHGIVTYNWSMTIADLASAEIDFWEWRKEHLSKLITYEKAESGTRYHLRDCRLNSVEEGATAADGSKSITLSGTALSHDED